MKIGAYLSLAAGLILLGLAISQWNDSTASTAGQAFNGYRQGDRTALRSLGQGSDLNDTVRLAFEAVAGVTWLVIGGVLLKKAAGPSFRPPRNSAAPRR